MFLPSGVTRPPAGGGGLARSEPLQRALDTMGLLAYLKGRERETKRQLPSAGLFPSWLQGLAGLELKPWNPGQASCGLQVPKPLNRVPAAPRACSWERNLGNNWGTMTRAVGA